MHRERNSGGPIEEQLSLRRKSYRDAYQALRWSHGSVDVILMFFLELGPSVRFMTVPASSSTRCVVGLVGSMLSVRLSREGTDRNGH